jgi:leucine dehydrogenase
MNTSSTDLYRLSPAQLAKYLRTQQIHHFYFIYDHETQRLQASHTQLQSLADTIHHEQNDFDAHEGMFFAVSKHDDVIHSAFIHQTCRGQAQGGTRFWNYASFADLLFDGIRLSKGMTYKNALAGLWWGGGKGVISRPPLHVAVNEELSERLFTEYGYFISSLRGCYITAEDVGTRTIDMDHAFSQTRFITCIPQAKGGSGNPSAATALGVVRGMEAALFWKAQQDKNHDRSIDPSTLLKDQIVLVQGVGHVGTVIAELLLTAGARIIATDISQLRVDLLKARWHAHPQWKDQVVDIRCTERGDLTPLSWECDILCPAATGAVLNADTISHIKAKIVCGASNNQLKECDTDGQALKEKGCLYIPDFLVNRMGIVNCANEQYGYLAHDEMFDRHLNYIWEHSIFQVTQNVLSYAESHQTHPHQAAEELASEQALQLHPIWGHRGQAIIQGIRTSEWSQTNHLNQES